MTEQIAEYLNFARNLAYEAGELTLKYFQNGIRAEYKADHTPVTQADRESEQLIRKRLQEQYPGHAILGEEFGASGSESGEMPRWIIDPIDGTRAFVRGVPLYAVLIGVEIQNRVQAGVAYFPALNEMLSAGTGLGCDWNARTARLSDIDCLENALVVHENVTRFREDGRQESWERIQAAAGYVSGWGDAFGYLLVATGRAEVMLSTRLKPWDCAPYAVIFSELGGYFGDWHGRRTIYSHEGLATTDKLLSQVVQTLNGEKPALTDAAKQPNH